MDNKRTPTALICHTISFINNLLNTGTLMESLGFIFIIAENINNDEGACF